MVADRPQQHGRDERARRLLVDWAVRLAWQGWSRCLAGRSLFGCPLIMVWLSFGVRPGRHCGGRVAQEGCVLLEEAVPLLVFLVIGR